MAASTAFQTAYEAFGADVPVFSIMFGSADPTQLEELAELTHARVSMAVRI